MELFGTVSDCIVHPEKWKELRRELKGIEKNAKGYHIIKTKQNIQNVLLVLDSIWQNDPFLRIDSKHSWVGHGLTFDT